MYNLNNNADNDLIIMVQLKEAVNKFLSLNRTAADISKLKKAFEYIWIN